MTAFDDRRLSEPGFLAFPFRVTGIGPEIADRSAHVRQVIEQVLFTAPGERVFRPDFGGGVDQLVFEQASTAVTTLARKRLQASLSAALEGEVDPATLDIEVETEADQLRVVVSYELTRVGRRAVHSFLVGGGRRG
jgi:phage baseplate assembly protein W